ncbi:MAG: alpha/beta hydrolase, partial [Planctomycetia bacterium]
MVQASGRIDRASTAPRTGGWLVAATVAGLLLPTAAVWAQPAAKAAAKPAVAKPAAPAPADPATEDVADYLDGSESKTLLTSDGVFLGVTYWSPKEASRDTPVVMLLHSRGRSQRDWFPFAKQLYDDGIAVVTFDFRGHGESRNV